MKKINSKLFEVLFLFLVSLPPVFWLRPNQLLLGHDSGFRLNPVSQLQNLFFSWSTITNFGTDWSFFKGFLITQFPEAFFTFITRSLWLGQIFTFIFWFFLMGIAMYVCVNNFFPEKKSWFIRIFSSLLFMYNFFILQGWFIAERAKFSVYAALPLGFFIIYNIFERKYSLLKGTILFSLTFFFLNGGGNPPLYGGLLLSYFVLFLFFTFTNYSNQGISSLLTTIKIGISLFFGTIIVNSYWIIPQAYLALTTYTAKLSTVGGVSGILGWESVISKNASILNLFRLQGVPDWYDNPVHPYANIFLTNWLLILISFMPLLIILIGLIIIKNKKKDVKNQKLLLIVFFTFLLGVMFSGGTHPPLGLLYEVLILKVPGFAIFRSSYYKFSPALFFSVSILVAYFLSSILNVIKDKKRRIILSLASIIIFLLYNFPFFITNFNVFNPPFTTKVSLPSYTVDMFSYIEKNISPSTKILLLPEFQDPLMADSYSWGYWSLDALPRIALPNPIISSDSNADLVNALYEAVKNNNEDKFIQLAKLLGIKKILWRGDVLYNDHLTKSSDLESEKNNLEHFSSVKLEKNFGKWSLYSVIGSQDKLFWGINHINQISENVSTYDISNNYLNDNKSLGFIYNSQTNQKVNLSNITNKYIYASEGFLYDNPSIESIKDSLVMPSVKFLPWSKFYFIINFLQKRDIARTRNLPQQRIDVDLSDANKRLVEIWRMGYKDFNAKTPFYAELSTKRYEASINDALTQVSGLSVLEKNYYLIRIAAYIEFQKAYIQFFNQNKTIEKSVNELLAFMNDKDSFLRGNIWTSTTNADRKSFINIPSDGIYSLLIKQNVDLPSIISIDNKQINDIQHVALSKGMHLVEINYQEPPSDAFVINNSVANLSNSIVLNTGEKIGINNFSFNKNYFIKFTYKLGINKKVFLEIYQNNETDTWKGNLQNPMLMSLTADGKPHQVLYYYKPYIGAKKAFLSFISKQKNETLMISNLSIEQDINPRVYAVKNGIQTQTNIPNITFLKKDPTDFIVSVKNAENPYILFFNQTFSPGWKATIISSNDNTKINEINHLDINGYGNGWFIDKKGNYTISIEYTGQKYFYVGLIVTMLSLVISIFLLKTKAKYV